MENSEILLYQTEDGQTKIDVRLEDETVWLSQVQMAELFQTTKQNISLHIKNVFEEGELQENATVKDYLTVQTEGKREVQRNLKIYNLDVIISVGCMHSTSYILLKESRYSKFAGKRLSDYVRSFV